MNILQQIKDLSKKMNLKADETNYKYYIVVQNNKVDMMLVKSNKNLLSELGYFNNADDCRDVINKYQDKILAYV
jgi:hypothetical protein